MPPGGIGSPGSAISSPVAEHGHARAAVHRNPRMIAGGDPTASAAAAMAARRRGDRQHHGLAAAGAHQRGQRMRVGADDAAGRDRLAGQRDLVAGRQDGDARAAVHREPGMVGGGGQADVARAQPLAGAAISTSPRGKILAGAADVAAGAAPPRAP